MLGPGAFYLFLLVAAGAVTGGLAWYAWRHREEPGARPLAAAMVAVTVWTVTEVLALSETGGSHLHWERIQWTAIAVVPLFFFFFMVDFTGYEWVFSRRILPLFFVVPGLTVALAFTNGAYHLMWTDPVLIDTNGLVTLDLAFGPWFWVYFAYAYTLQVIGFVLLLRLVAASEFLYLDQTVLIVVGILAPLAGNALSVFEMAPLPGLDLTPLGFTVTGIAFGNALFRYRLFDLLPATRRLGRQAALVGLDDGVIVDTDRQVLYLNPAAADILGCDPGAALGEPVTGFVDSRELNFDATDRLAELTIEGRTYEVETAPVSDRRGEAVGHTVLLYDVTERIQRERELRAQRDRYRQLERINTVIREVNQALVSATTVNGLERTVVETLATPELYDDVWLGTNVSDGPPVRMSAGDESPHPADPDAGPPELEGSDGGGPLAERTPTDGGLVEEGWATVAILYGRTVYGALTLHTDRDGGFGERELAVLEELGETVGHALMVRLAEATDADTAGIDAATDHPGVSDVRELATDGATTLEVHASDGTLAHPFVECGANVTTATAADGRCRVNVELPPDANVRAVLEGVCRQFPDTELLAKRETDPTDGEALPDGTEMTDRQREALEAAFQAGYFDWPRESTGEEVAESLDISSATLHSHLRKAESRLLESFFER